MTPALFILQQPHQGILTVHSVAAMPCARFVALLATGGTAVLHVRLCSRTSRACPELVEGCLHLPGRAQLDCSVFVPHVITLSHPERLLLFLVILSEARRSEATERESKDPCTSCPPTITSGNSHRAFCSGNALCPIRGASCDGWDRCSAPSPLLT